MSIYMLTLSHAAAEHRGQRTITGDMPAGQVFVGEIHADSSYSKLPVASGTFLVVSERGVHSLVDLASGTLWRNHAYVIIYPDDPALIKLSIAGR